MRNMKQVLCLLAAGIISLGTAAGTLADPASYDPTGAAAQAFSVSDDGTSIRTRIYPGDRIANAAVYLGMDNLSSGSSEGASDVLDDGTACWMNRTGKVYTVAAIARDTGEVQMDAEGNPVLDEAGNPIPVTATDYVLDTWGGVVEVVRGDSATDAADPSSGSSLRDSAYTLRGDTVYNYTDANGGQQAAGAGEIDAAAYPDGTQVYITYDAPVDPSFVFQRWMVYSAGDGGNLSAVSDDQLASLGIPEITGPGSLSAESVQAAGGRLYITVKGTGNRLVFVPVFAAAPQEPAPEETPQELPQETAAQEGLDGPAAEAAGQDGLDGQEAEAFGQADPDGGETVLVDLGQVELGEAGQDQPDPAIQIGDGIEAEEVPAEPTAVSPVYELYVNYIDPQLMGPSTGYFTYAGGEFTQTITTAPVNAEGLVFAGWTADDETVHIESADQAEAQVSFDPAAALSENRTITVTANYKQPEPSVVLDTLTAQNAQITDVEDITANDDGSVSATVEQGTVVTVQAAPAPEGMEFDQWSVAADGEITTSDISEPVLEVTMTASNVSVEALYLEAAQEPQSEKQSEKQSEQQSEKQSEQQSEKQSEQQSEKQSEQQSEKQSEQQSEKQSEQQSEKQSEQQSEKQSEKQSEQQSEKQSETQSEQFAPAEVVYTLTVNGGTAESTSLAEGEKTVLKAGGKDGYQFTSWTVSGSGSVENASSEKTTFTMGAGDAVVTANYTSGSYTLTVKNGSGGGTYKAGEKVSITPDFPASGKQFESWVTTKGSVTYDDAYNYYATVTMQANDARVKATYSDGPSANDNKITGLENGAEYLKSTTLAFTAVGAGMDNTDPNPGDYHYRPTGYQIGGVSGSWSSSPYTTSMAINAAGDYTLTVTYAREVYNGSSWKADGVTVTKSITFHVVNALSVNTGDSTPLVPLAIAAAAAVAVIVLMVVLLIRRRRR